MESSSGCSVWFGHRHRDHPEDTDGGLSERGEDFYQAISEDIQLATREDFFMAMDTISGAQCERARRALGPHSAIRMHRPSSHRKRGHLRRVLERYVRHYNEHRPHRGLALAPPHPPTAKTPSTPATITTIRRHEILVD